MTLRKQLIKEYMIANIADHVDPLTGEVNDTSLAEDACTHFNGFEGDDVPDLYFELSFVVAEKYEIQTGVREPRLSSGLSGLINSLPSDYF